MKKLTSFIAALLISVGVSASPATAQANQEIEIRKVTKETPLVLKHANILFEEGQETIAGHYSHSSHVSHASHRSHYSHRSGY